MGFIAIINQARTDLSAGCIQHVNAITINTSLAANSEIVQFPLRAMSLDSAQRLQNRNCRVDGKLRMTDLL